jgi:hypothetical protein
MYWRSNSLTSLTNAASMSSAATPYKPAKPRDDVDCKSVEGPGWLARDILTGTFYPTASIHKHQWDRVAVACKTAVSTTSRVLPGTVKCIHGYYLGPGPNGTCLSARFLHLNPPADTQIFFLPYETITLWYRGLKASYSFMCLLVVQIFQVL